MFLTSVVVFSLTRFYGAGRVDLVAVSSAVSSAVPVVVLALPLQPRPQ